VRSQHSQSESQVLKHSTLLHRDMCFKEEAKRAKKWQKEQKFLFCIFCNFLPFLLPL
jgi:hypothetical protein